MVQLAKAGKKSPVIRQLAVNLTRYLPQKDWVAEIKTLFEFVRDRIRYVKDTRNVETLHTAEKVLENGQGDCDDKSILLASLLESLGHKTRFVAVGFRPNSFSHVYVEVFTAGKWIPLETTELVEMGWSVKNIAVKMYVSNDANKNIGGLAGKRVIAALNAQAAAVQAAFAKANLPEATQADIDNANKLQAEYNAAIASYDAAAKKKSKSLVGQLRTLHLQATKVMGKISPSFHAHAQSEERKVKIEKLQTEALHIQGQKPTAQTVQRLEDINAVLAMTAKKEKTYMKQGVIAATIASIVVGIFTFGAGGAAIQGAYQALKQGAIAAAKKLLIGAIAAAVAKGASKSDAAKATQAVEDLSKYPPDPNLPNLGSMIADSQAKKQAAVQKTLTWAIPAGAIALLFLI